MNRLRSYDLENGEIVWESAGLTMNPIPSPVAAEGMVFATSGFQGNNLKAIRIDGAKATSRERHPSSGRSTATRLTFLRQFSTMGFSIS